MNIFKETAMIKPEAIPGTQFIRGLDIVEGDLVQIVADGKEAAGRLGRVIGVNIRKGNTGRYVFVFRVELSNKECISVRPRRLRLLNENGRSEVK